MQRDTHACKATAHVSRGYVSGPPTSVVPRPRPRPRPRPTYRLGAVKAASGLGHARGEAVLVHFLCVRAPVPYAAGGVSLGAPDSGGRVRAPYRDELLGVGERELVADLVHNLLLASTASTPRGAPTRGSPRCQRRSTRRAHGGGRSAHAETEGGRPACALAEQETERVLFLRPFSQRAPPRSSALLFFLTTHSSSALLRALFLSRHPRAFPRSIELVQCLAFSPPPSLSPSLPIRPPLSLPLSLSLPRTHLSAMAAMELRKGSSRRGEPK